MLHIAEYLPSFMLPSSFNEFDRSGATQKIARSPDTPIATGPQEALDIDEVESEGIVNAEPLMREDTAVAPASAVEPAYFGPTFSMVDVDEFSELLTAAQQVASWLGEGDLASKESVARKGQAYMALARLADNSSFLIQPGHSPEAAAKARLAEQLFKTTLRNDAVQRDLPQIALRWWQYAERPSTGIVLVGQVKRLQATNAGTIAFGSLEEELIAPEIPVLITGATELQEGDFIGLAGSIEANPQEQLPALDASVSPLVIAKYTFSLDTADKEQGFPF
jgi:hypothetical protein